MYPHLSTKTSNLILLKYNIEITLNLSGKFQLCAWEQVQFKVSLHNLMHDIPMCYY